MRTLGFSLVTVGIAGTVLVGPEFGGRIPFPPVLLMVVGVAMILAKEVEDLRR